MAFNFQQLLKELPKGTVIQVPIFEQYIIPFGLLTPAPEEHALFFYYVNAREIYEKHIKNTVIQMEDEADLEYSFEGMINSIAQLYGVKVDEMTKAWQVIDRQCDALNLPKLPDEYQYRFGSTPTIVTVQ